MSHYSKIFQKTPIDIPNRSGFDISFENLLTMKCGQLIPVLCEEVLPNETYSLGYMAQVQLPPMATDFYGRIDMRLESFFVPSRILWAGWEAFLTMPNYNPFSPTVYRPTRLPSLTMFWKDNFNPTDNPISPFYTVSTELMPFPYEPGSLLDYLGMKLDKDEDYSGTSIRLNNILPLLAYHKIYDEWYRNPNLTKPLFVKPASPSTGGLQSDTNLSGLPYMSSVFYEAQPVSSSQGNNNFVVIDEERSATIVPRAFYFTGNDNSTPDYAGPNIFTIHQRQWAKDYYTTASLYPQGSDSIGGARATVETSGSNSTLSISQLRAANVLQRWYERNNIAGQRYVDQMKATWGITPSDAFLDRPLFLGAHKFGLYSKSTHINNQLATGVGGNGQNPFVNQAGAKAGDTSGMGQGSLFDSFKSTEHGYLITIASIVPHAYYSTGVRRYLNRSQIGDFANPLLQGLGEQAILRQELISNLNSGPLQTFGYQQQYAEYKYHDDEVHGLLRDDGDLSAFVLSRSFTGSNVELGTNFVEIPTNFLDQVLSVRTNMGAVAWCDFYFSFKKVSPLSEYVIPTLGDLKNTHKENINYRGTYL